MENDNQLKLPAKFSKYLENFPEQGMGYQIIDIEFFGGKTLINRIVFNSTYLKLNENEKIDSKKIKAVTIKNK
jgi:hypothetical protein